METILSDLEYGRAQLLNAIEGLSQRELTEIPIYEGWTIKDVLAHVIGWDRRVIQTIPLMLQNRADEIPDVEVDEYNRRSVEAGKDKSLAEILAEIKDTHRQIMGLLAPLSRVDVEMRRERHGRIITIQSYVIDVMMEHERQHAVEIEQWRKTLAESIDPQAIKTALLQNRADFWEALKGLSEAEALDNTAAGGWSVKDVVGHLAAWEQLMLKAARHIYDPSWPSVPPITESFDEWNAVMVKRRAGNTWREECDDLRNTGAAVDEFVRKLTPGDWKLRGPYPWHDDRGSLAELLTHISEHYTHHLPDILQWRSQKLRQRPPSKPWVRWILNNEAAGLLKKEYDSAIKRAGKVWNIVRVQSLRPAALHASIRLYGSVVHQSTPHLDRPAREMIAVVVSQANQCHY